MIGFAGLSHLGIVSCVAAASKGFEVIGHDTRAEICSRLSDGHLPILEPGLPELFVAGRDVLHFSADAAALRACDLIYFSLDIPTDQDNRSDQSGLRQLFDEVIPYVKPGATLVLLSQVRPGFTRRLAEDLHSVYEDQQLQLFYQVETLIFGLAVERALHPERYIVGCADPKGELPLAYLHFLSSFGCPIMPMRYESAELAKISINVFLAASLSATNTLAETCEAIGADWTEIAPSLRLDRRIGPHAYLAPGLGIAGGNIERDLVTLRNLARDHGINSSVPEAFLAHSQHRRNWVMRVLGRQVLPRHTKPVIAVWGLAYKPNTKSVKNSPTLALLSTLGGIPVRLYDPEATLGNGYPEVIQTTSPLDACRGAHALIIMTAWEEFTAISPSAVKQALVDPIVIDPAAVWCQQNLPDHGFIYSTLGRPIARQTSQSRILINGQHEP